MRTQVTCDDVFEILTRGPFPAGREEDSAVELHLAACHDCRRLADALRPAVALFHEVLVDHDGEQLPEYRGSLPAAQQQLPSLNRLAADVVHGGRRRKGPQREENVTLANGVRMTCAILLGGALCLVIWSAATFVTQTQRLLAGKSQPRFTAGNVNVTQRTELTLAALALPGGCWPASSDAHPATTAKHVCCTGCHSAAHPARLDCQATWSVSCEKCHDHGPPTRLKTRDVAIAQQTCQACHDG